FVLEIVVQKKNSTDTNKIQGSVYSSADDTDRRPGLERWALPNLGRFEIKERLLAFTGKKQENLECVTFGDPVLQKKEYNVVMGHIISFKMSGLGTHADDAGAVRDGSLPL
ncbi:Sodium/hydrogen exchanger 7, partial [Frankliniella fusca]